MFYYLRVMKSLISEYANLNYEGFLITLIMVVTLFWFIINMILDRKRIRDNKLAKNNIQIMILRYERVFLFFKVEVIIYFLFVMIYKMIVIREVSKGTLFDANVGVDILISTVLSFSSLAIELLILSAFYFIMKNVYYYHLKKMVT